MNLKAFQVGIKKLNFRAFKLKVLKNDFFFKHKVFSKKFFKAQNYYIAFKIKLLILNLKKTLRISPKTN